MHTPTVYISELSAERRMQTVLTMFSHLFCFAKIYLIELIYVDGFFCL